jgi:hypothetical protein
MTMTINGSGTITGLSAGGLPSATINQTNLNTNVASNGPAFRAIRITSQQVISTATATKVQFNSKTFDTNSNFDSTTNYRFTPTVAGYYQLQACLQTDSFATGDLQILIYKNGASTNFVNVPTTIPANPSLAISDISYANGSTDYFEIYVYQNSGTNKNIYAGSAPAYCWFSGALIRSA